jgi:glycine C-acetyltransferase
MSGLDEQVGTELDALREAGTFKRFNAIESPQGPVVEMAGRGEVIVLSSNNYLGLADHPEVVQAGIDGLKQYGAGTASVRFICGTFTPHLELERDLAEMSATEASLTYVSCWNANEASIPTLADETTALISDELNHASIIDAMRLAKPERKVRYKHSDMGELRDALRACDPAQRKVIVTDGVFSMEGDLAKLPDILELARAHDAIVVVDDSHGVGVMGETGRGVAEHYGVLGQVDVLTGTLGKALGGAAGGYVAASDEVCELLQQRSRPQLFSNVQRSCCGPRHARASRAADQASREHPVVPGRAARGGLRSARRRVGDRPDHRRRDRPRDRDLGAAARARRLRHRLRLSRRA